MRLTILRKTDLTPQQTRYLTERLAAPEHQYDCGPSTVWNTYGADTFYGFALADTGVPVGIADVSGPSDAMMLAGGLAHSIAAGGSATN